MSGEWGAVVDITAGGGGGGAVVSLSVARVRFPSGPDLRNLVRSQDSFLLAFRMADWLVVGGLKYRRERFIALSCQSARHRTHSWPTLVAGAVESCREPNFKGFNGSKEVANVAHGRADPGHDFRVCDHRPTEG